jgi:hypothetical protein
VSVATHLSVLNVYNYDLAGSQGDSASHINNVLDLNSGLGFPKLC